MLEHYFIYHIAGLKVGCTRRLRKRQGHYKGQTLELLEIIECDSITPQIAGDIEWRYADMFGYPRGKHYAVVGPKNPTHGLAVSKSQKGKPKSAEHARNISLGQLGKPKSPHPKESLERAAAKLRGRKLPPRSPEWCAKLSGPNPKKGHVPWNKGLTKKDAPNLRGGRRQTPV